MNTKDRLYHLKALIRGVFFSDASMHEKSVEVVNIMCVFTSDRIRKALYKYVQFLQRNKNGNVFLDIDSYFPGDSLPIGQKTNEELNRDMDDYNSERPGVGIPEYHPYDLNDGSDNIQPSPTTFGNDIRDVPYFDNDQSQLNHSVCHDFTPPSPGYMVNSNSNRTYATLNTFIIKNGELLYSITSNNKNTISYLITINGVGNYIKNETDHVLKYLDDATSVKRVDNAFGRGGIIYVSIKPMTESCNLQSIPTIYNIPNEPSITADASQFQLFPIENMQTTYEREIYDDEYSDDFEQDETLEQLYVSTFQQYN